jgi:ATP-binding cassette subfamily B protein
MKDKTVFVVAHRLSTIKKMDRILVFDKGKIVQDGTHNSLLNQEGLYRELWQMQSNIIQDIGEEF